MQPPVSPPSAVPPHADGPERLEVRHPRTRHLDLSAMFPGQLYLHGPQNQRRVAFTFDDGVDERYTPAVLEALSALGVRGTFFIVGQRARAAPAVVRRIVREGHAIGNHTYHHANLTHLTPAEIRTEVEACEGALAEIAGHSPRLFRPPYGALSPDIVRELIGLNYRVIFWNVDSLDWMGLTAPQIVANILAHTGPGDIILQHSAGGRNEDLSGTVRALPYVVRTLQQEGYRFETVPALLDIPEYREVPSSP